MIVDQISNQITIWCLDHHIEDTFYNLFDFFMKECKLIKRNFSEIYRIVQDDGTLQQKVETVSDLDFSVSILDYSIEEKLFLAATAPLWIPIIIGATVVAIPIAIGSAIKKAIVESRKIIEYRENKMKYMLKLAEEKIEIFNADMLYKAVSSANLPKLKSSLEEVCRQIIPKQIMADKELIENLMKENRDYQTLKLEYSPIEQKCKEIVGNLLYVKIKYLSDCKPRISKSILGRGVHVHFCDVDISGNKVQCAVRRLASPIQSDPYLQLSLVEKMM